MNDLAPMGNTSVKSKSFWERPEGTTGMITIAVAGVIAVALGNFFLPAILTFLGLAIAATSKLIVLGALCVLAAGLFVVVTDPKFRTLASYFFKLIMRKITQLMVEIDPIGIAKNYIETLGKHLETMARRVAELNGQIKILERQINTNKTKIENDMATAKVAREKNLNNQFTLSARSAGRLTKSNVTLEQLLAKVKMIHRALTKYRDACELFIADLTEDVRVKEQERALVLSAYGAMAQAKAILKGSGTQRDLFEQAMEFMVNDAEMKMGEIEDFMQTSQSFIDGMDLQNGVFEEAALKKIEEWEQKADSLLLSGGEKRLLLEDLSSDPLMSQTFKIPTASPDYAEILRGSSSTNSNTNRI